MKKLLISLAAILCVLPCRADLIKQGATYSRTVLMTSSTDHITGVTGGTLTLTLSKAGAAYGSISDTVTELSGGVYKIALTGTDTNTLGALDLHVTATGADPTDAHDQVVAFDPTSATNLGLSALPAVAAGTAGGVPTATNSSGQVVASLVAGNVTGSVASVTGNVTGSVASVTGNVAGSVGSVVTTPTALTTAYMGTASAGSSTTITLAAGPATTDVLKGDYLAITGGTGQGQARTITGWNGGTLVATVSRPWAVTPDATTTYGVIMNPHPALDSNLAVTVGTNSDKTGYTASTVTDKTGYSLTASQMFNTTGSVGSVTGAVGSVTGAVASVTAPVVASSVTGSVGSVTGNVGGNVVGSVASVTGSVGSVTAPVTAGTVSDKTGYTASTVTDKTGYTVATVLDKTGYSLTTAPPTTAQIAAAVPTTAQIAASILLTPANLLATNASNQVAVSNLPADYLSSLEQTRLATASTAQQSGAAVTLPALPNVTLAAGEATNIVNTLYASKPDLAGQAFQYLFLDIFANNVGSYGVTYPSSTSQVNSFLYYNSALTYNAQGKVIGRAFTPGSVPAAITPTNP